VALAQGGSMSTVDLRHGDCIEVMRALPANSVDAVVTDPPYGLEFMGKEWDKFTHSAARFRDPMESDRRRGTTLPRGSMPDAYRAGRPFQDWCELWAAECLRVLKPGGHLLAFGGTRTWHRLACAVEDAGFEMRDSIAWLYGSGFPKSHDVSKAIDKAGGDPLAFRAFARAYAAAVNVSPLTHSDIDRHLGIKSSSCYWARDDHRGGMPPRHHWEVARDLLGLPGEFERLYDEAEREVIETRVRADRRGDGTVVGLGHSGDASLTAPATEAAQQWQGWGTALKPGYEPVVCARKPFNAVPLGSEVLHLHHLIGALLWLSLSPAKRAELSSPSRNHEHSEDTCVSARALAAAALSLDGSDATDTFSSLATASTFWNIVRSWNAILAALSDQTRTSTTSTRSSTTTGLRILNSLLAPITSATTMPRCWCLTSGQTSHAKSAGRVSDVEWENWLHTLSASAPESATEGIALAVASALADTAASLSDDQAAESSALPSATTAAPASGSPAFEPIVVARKPLVGTVAANVLAHGTGALNVDACRIGYDPNDPTLAWGEKFGGGKRNAQGEDYAQGSGTSGLLGVGKTTGSVSPAGRWPANVVLDEDQAAALDQQSGTLTSGKMKPTHTTAGTSGRPSAYGADAAGGFTTMETYGDSGGASRFFYVAKAPKSERPVVDGVAHPTVKPLALMRWLVRLVTPPGGTVLDPFGGSGPTAEVCILEDFDCLIIEREADYLPLIQARIFRAQAATAEQAEIREPDQLDLFGDDAA
jgi:DNA modification methylase